MALTERQVTDRIEILEDGRMQVRTATIIERDGVEISRAFHREVIDVEDDVSAKDQRVRDIVGAVWTPQVKAARKAQKVLEAAQAQGNN